MATAGHGAAVPGPGARALAAAHVRVDGRARPRRGRGRADGRAHDLRQLRGAPARLPHPADVPRGDGAPERHPEEVAAADPQGGAGGLLQRQLRLRQGRHRPVPRRRHGAGQAHPVPDHHRVQLRRLQRVRQVVRAPGRHLRIEIVHAGRPVLPHRRAERGRHPVRGRAAQGADRALRVGVREEVRHRRAARDPRLRRAGRGGLRALQGALQAPPGALRRLLRRHQHDGTHQRAARHAGRRRVLRCGGRRVREPGRPGARAAVGGAIPHRGRGTAALPLLQELPEPLRQVGRRRGPVHVFHRGRHLGVGVPARSQAPAGVDRRADADREPDQPVHRRALRADQALRGGVGGRRAHHPLDQVLPALLRRAGGHARLLHARAGRPDAHGRVRPRGPALLRRGPDQEPHRRLLRIPGAQESGRASCSRRRGEQLTR